MKVEFETEDGTSVDEELKFSNLGDFTKKGIVEQSDFLKDLNAQQDGYHKFMKQLRSNKILKSALHNPEAKQAYLQALQAMIQEIEQADQ